MGVNDQNRNTQDMKCVDFAHNCLKIDFAGLPIRYFKVGHEQLPTIYVIDNVLIKSQIVDYT